MIAHGQKAWNSALDYSKQLLLLLIKHIFGIFDIPLRKHVFSAESKQIFFFCPWFCSLFKIRVLPVYEVNFWIACLDF